MDLEVDDASLVGSPPVWRGVELETAVERFLLRMYNAGAKDADAVAETGANAASEDTEGVAEKIKSSLEDKQEGEGDRRRWEIWLLGRLDQNDGSPRLLPPPGVADMDGNGNVAAKTAGAVLLQRGLRASNLEFVEGEVRVLQDASPPSAVDSESSSAGRGRDETLALLCCWCYSTAINTCCFIETRSRDLFVVDSRRPR